MDSAERFSKHLGVDTYLGNATFVSENEVEVNGQKLKFLKCVIASGAKPFIPPQFLNDKNQTSWGAENPYFTTENIFNMTK